MMKALTAPAIRIFAWVILPTSESKIFGGILMLNAVVDASEWSEPNVISLCNGTEIDRANFSRSIQRF